MRTNQFNQNLLLIIICPTILMLEV